MKSVVVAVVVALALYGLAGFASSDAPRHSLTVRQAKLVMRSYADIEHLPGFEIVYCRRLSPARIHCRVHESPGYLDGVDSYLMGVKRLGCGFLVRDCGTGQGCAWQRWL